MKRAIGFLVLAVFAFAPDVALAGSGSAIVPFWQSQFVGQLNRSQTVLWLTNVTGQRVNVSVTFYDRQGNIVTETDVVGDPVDGVFRALNADLNYDEAPQGASVAFTLLGRNSANLSINTPFEFGYAVVEWRKNNSDDPVALVGYALVDVFNDPLSRHLGQSIPVNQGLPF